MKAALLFTATGPLVIVTSHPSVTSDALTEKLRAKGIDKFIGYELPLETVRERYGGHYNVVMNDLHEQDDLRVLDFNGNRIYQLFRLSELGESFLYEPQT